jgi:hypothetical protein
MADIFVRSVENKLFYYTCFVTNIYPRLLFPPLLAEKSHRTACSNKRPDDLSHRYVIGGATARPILRTLSFRNFVRLSYFRRRFDTGNLCSLARMQT